MGAPLLSVCLPTWNGAKHLARLLACLEAQSLADLEILVCDDASTDGTCDVARASGDSRLSVYAFDDRRGIGGNWNRALGLAHGRYAVIVGQDDEVVPQWAERLVGLLEAHPEADLAFSRRRIVLDEAARASVAGTFFLETYPRMLAEFYARVGEVIPTQAMVEVAMDHFFKINLIGEPTFVVFRREAPAAGRGFNETLQQLLDWEFATRFFARGPIVHCPEELGTFHVHGTATSLANAEKKELPEEYFLQAIVMEELRDVLSPAQTAALREHRAQLARDAEEWLGGS